MECKFVVKQKVVYVGPGDGKGVAAIGCVEKDSPALLLTEGDIYTIVQIVAEDGLVLLVRRERPTYCGYDHLFFRPLQDRPKEADTDISVFKPLLNVRVVEGVDAL
jgi:hypothetical protein